MAKKRASLSKKNKSHKRRVKSFTERNKRDKRPPLLLENERKVHEEIINRRITGGVTLTQKEISEAYVRALEQWQKLPGSITKSPTNVLLIQQPSKSQYKEAAPEQTDDDTNNGGNEIGS
jgi:hypothetical protein